MDFVAILLISMCLQAAVLTGLELGANSAWNYLIMLIFMLIVFASSGIMSMHAPPPIGPYLWWQLIVIITLISLGIYHSIAYFCKPKLKV